MGAVAAATQAGFGEEPLVGFDMGGTSTDVFCVPAGQNPKDWERSPLTELAGLSLLAPRLPIHTVAAGGGSILSGDGGRLLVGPRSAGADPGRACYRRVHEGHKEIHKDVCRHALIGILVRARSVSRFFDSLAFHQSKKFPYHHGL